MKISYLYFLCISLYIGARKSFFLLENIFICISFVFFVFWRQEILQNAPREYPGASFLLYSSYFPLQQSAFTKRSECVLLFGKDFKTLRKRQTRVPPQVSEKESARDACRGRCSRRVRGIMQKLSWHSDVYGVYEEFENPFRVLQDFPESVLSQGNKGLPESRGRSRQR